MRRSISQTYWVILFFGLSNALCGQPNGMQSVPIESQGKGISQGVKVSYFLPECRVDIEQGEDPFGKNQFKIIVSKGDNVEDMKLNIQQNKEIIKLLQKIQKSSYRVKSNQPIWAFDGTSIRVEIRSGVRHILYEDIIENVPNKEVFNELLRIVKSK